MAKRLFCSLAVAASLPVLTGGCASTTTNAPKNSQPGFMEKVGASVKSGTAKFAAAVTPKTKTTPVVTPSPSGKAGPNVFVAAAQMREENGELDDAESQYKKALEMDPNHLGALTGYARLEDRRHNFDAAVKLYQRAMKKHSKDASVHNDFGLCYHRHGKLPEAAKELERAVELNQDGKLYRDNLAAIYIDQGKTKEALAQLTAAHGEAVGNYNMAYLLEQKNNHAAAIVHFRKAVEKDPSLVAAHQWIARLSSAAAPSDRSSTAAIAIAARPEGVDSAGHNAKAVYTVEPIGADAISALRATSNAVSVSEPSGRDVPAAAAKNGAEYRPSPRLTNALRDGAAPASDRSSTDNRLPSTTPEGG